MLGYCPAFGWRSRGWQVVRSAFLVDKYWDLQEQVAVRRDFAFVALTIALLDAVVVKERASR